jgi:hypothetical protein
MERTVERHGTRWARAPGCFLQFFLLQLSNAGPLGIGACAGLVGAHAQRSE